MNRYEAEQALTEKENNAVVYNTKFAFAVEQISEHSSLRKRICDYVFEHIYDDVDRKIKEGVHEGNYGLCVYPFCRNNDPMNDSLENMYRTLVSLAPSYLKGMVREHNRCDMQFITETVAQHYRNEGYSVSTPYTDKYGRVHAHAEDRYSDGSIMYTVTLRWGGKSRRNTPPSYISREELPVCENKVVETAAGQIAEYVELHYSYEWFAVMRDRLREIIEKNMDGIWDNASEEEHSAFNTKSRYLQKNYNRNPARRIAWYTGTNGGIITAVALLGTIFMPAGVWFIPIIVTGTIVLNLVSPAYDLPCKLWEGHFLRRIRKKSISLAGNTLQIMSLPSCDDNDGHAEDRKYLAYIRSYPEMLDSFSSWSNNEKLRKCVDDIKNNLAGLEKDLENAENAEHVDGMRKLVCYYLPEFRASMAQYTKIQRTGDTVTVQKADNDIIRASSIVTDAIRSVSENVCHEYGNTLTTNVNVMVQMAEMDGIRRNASCI